jgi:D-ribose pyranase
MIRTGILNPQINSLLARVRHTNMLVIADRGYPYWPMIETIDISLIDGVPTVLQVLDAIRPNFDISQAFMAKEFISENSPETQKRFATSLKGIPVSFEAYGEMKLRVPQAIGLIRTGDVTQYANMILVSGRV